MLEDFYYISVAAIGRPSKKKLLQRVVPSENKIEKKFSKMSRGSMLK